MSVSLEILGIPPELQASGCPGLALSLAGRCPVHRDWIEKVNVSQAPEETTPSMKATGSDASESV